MFAYRNIIFSLFDITCFAVFHFIFPITFLIFSFFVLIQSAVFFSFHHLYVFDFKSLYMLEYIYLFNVYSYHILTHCIDSHFLINANTLHEETRREVSQFTPSCTFQNWNITTRRQTSSSVYPFWTNHSLFGFRFLGRIHSDAHIWLKLYTFLPVPFIFFCFRDSGKTKWFSVVKHVINILNWIIN